MIVYYNIRLPDRYYVTKGGCLEFDTSVGITASDYADAAASCSADFSADNMETKSVSLKLFGIFPIKDVDVCEVEEAAVIPCGIPFGIKMLTDGVMVVNVTAFESDGVLVSPAKEAGIKKGDVIVSVSGRKVSSTEDIDKAVKDSGGKTVGVRIIRGNTESVYFLKPVSSSEDNAFHAGMWLRDSSAGIGTMTFYDPSTGAFGGLGHPVCDIDTGEILPLYSGEAADVVITGVKKGTEGDPGELMGAFLTDSSIGSIDRNSENGLYGVLDSAPVFASAVPIAQRQDVEEGSAYILSTIFGSTPEKYEIEIEKTDISDSPKSHNMIIRVTDERLIEKAGGIVQGMSGSPIMQNGKLVGAVTHVFVSDPLKGYGVFADSMYSEMKDTLQEKSAA